MRQRLRTMLLVCVAAPWIGCQNAPGGAVDDGDDGPADVADAAGDAAGPAEVAAPSPTADAAVFPLVDVQRGPPFGDIAGGPGDAGSFKGPPTTCGCPQMAGTSRPPECLPCAPVLSDSGSCLPPQQTAPLCPPPPAVCNCNATAAKAPPAACGCPTSFDWLDNLAKLAGVSKASLTAADVAKKAKKIDTAKVSANLAATIAKAKSGQALVNNSAMSVKIAAAISALTSAGTYTVSTSNDSVSAGTCTAEKGELSCSGAPIFISFVHNFHDFVNYERSLSLLCDLVGYHTSSAVKLPLNVYLDTQVVDAWVTHYGEATISALLAANPSILATNYHVRAPLPYADDTYWRDWKNCDDDKMATMVQAYETFQLDRNDGELPLFKSADPAPGGYTYLAALAGYAPPVVTAAASGGTNSHADKLKKAMAAYYAANGATLVVSHAGGANKIVDLCSKDATNALFLRPESMAISPYSLKSTFAGSGAKLFAELVKNDNETWSMSLPPPTVSLFDDAPSKLMAQVQAGQSKRIFVNIKWHDDNFYMNMTPWLPIYANDISAYAAANDTNQHPTECNANVNCSSTVPLEDWNGDLFWNQFDVCPLVNDATACGLTASNIYWDVGRGVGVDDYEALCPGGQAGTACTGPTLIGQAACKRKCEYVKTSAEKAALTANYQSLVDYVKTNKRFRVVTGSIEASMAKDPAICP